MRFVAVVVAMTTVALALVACGPGRCIDPQELTYRVSRGEATLKKGERAEVTLLVVNRSESWMLVERVSGAHLAPGGPDSLVGAEPGSLEALPEGGYRFNMIAQQETPPILARGLVPPGQKLPIRVEVVPSEPSGQFVLHYRGLTTEEAAKYLLFPAIGEDGRVDVGHFLYWSRDDLYEASGPGDDEGNSSPLTRLVILGPEMLEKPRRCKVEMPYKFELE